MKPTTAHPAPLLLYACLAAIILWPFARRDLQHAGDLHAVVSAVVEAGNGLREGQFPIRVAPHQLDGTRYPLFQFYGNFPYTAAGLIDLIPGIGPYNAWKIVMFAALVGGGWFTYRCAARMTGRRGRAGAVIAGAAFMAAPYMLTDIYGRGAFAEAVAFNLLPAMLFSALRAFSSRGWRNVAMAAIAWALVGLSHNITYLYASVFLGALLLTLAPPWSRRWGRIAIAGILQAALLAWYFVPQWYTLDQLNITAETSTRSPAQSDGRVPGAALLAPKFVPLPKAPTLGMQAGWPVLGGMFLAAAAVVARRSKRIGGVAIRAAVLCALSCFMAWSPVDFWRFLPSTFRFVQFPYRLLAFAVLCGAIALACAIAMWRPRGLRVWQTLPLLLLVGLAASTYRPIRLPLDPETVPKAIAQPVAGGLNDYLVIAGGVVHLKPTGPPMLESTHGAGHARLRFRANVSDTTNVVLPVLYYPRLLRVLVDRQPVNYSRDGRFAGVTVLPGTHRIDVWFAGVGWANVVSVMGCIVVIAMLVITRRGSRRRQRRGSVALALIGAAVLLLGIRAPEVWAGLMTVIHPPVKVTVTASRPSIPQRSVDLAFDGEPGTEWHATGSAPITATIIPDRPRVLDKIQLEVRAGDKLLEGWQHVRIDLFRDGKLAASQSFDFPEAATQPVITLAPPGVPADRIELHFDTPVTKLRDGTGQVDAGAVNPGYREIRLHWK